MHWRSREQLPCTSQYNQLYQDVKRFSKTGEIFCKELMAVFHQRAELELTYAKGLQKLAGKLIRAAKEMTNNSTFSAWCHVSDEMFSRADAHRSLGSAFQAEATAELRQVLDEHIKRKRPLDSAIERTGKMVTTNWTDQLKLQKKLAGLTQEHEALFNFVENNKQICTEKEKQKMLNRLSKSAESQARVDEEYFHLNMEGHHIRLKWENTLKTCNQVIQEMEKHRIEVLGEVLNKYNLHMCSLGQALTHGQKQMQQTVQRVDLEKDIDTLLTEHHIPAEDCKDFLLLHYYEEDSKSVMCRERRRQALQVKLRRLEDSMSTTRRETQGIKRLLKTYSDNPSFSNLRNNEDMEQQLDEATLKLDLLEATHYKLSLSLCELEGQPKSVHPFSHSISKWKDKDSEHSVVQLSRPVKLRRSLYRSRRSLRASIIYRGPPPGVHNTAPTQGAPPEVPNTAPTQKSDHMPRAEDNTQGEDPADSGTMGTCKALYDFTPEHQDELAFKEGNVLNIHTKQENGWWFGELDGHRGHFPSTYVVEIGVENTVRTLSE